MAFQITQTGHYSYKTMAILKITPGSQHTSTKDFQE